MFYCFSLLVSLFEPPYTFGSVSRRKLFDFLLQFKDVGAAILHTLQAGDGEGSSASVRWDGKSLSCYLSVGLHSRLNGAHRNIPSPCWVVWRRTMDPNSGGSALAPFIGMEIYGGRLPLEPHTRVKRIVLRAPLALPSLAPRDCVCDCQGQ